MIQQRNSILFIFYNSKSIFFSSHCVLYIVSEKERQECGVSEACGCLWAYLADLRASEGSSHLHYNFFYDPVKHADALLPRAAALAPTLWPQFHLRWACPSEAQAGELEAQFRNMALKFSELQKVTIVLLSLAAKNFPNELFLPPFPPPLCIGGFPLLIMSNFEHQLYLQESLLKIATVVVRLGVGVSGQDKVCFTLRWGYR